MYTMTREELARLKRYTKEYCLRDMSPLGRALVYIGAVNAFFDGDWNCYYRPWHPIGLSMLIIEFIGNILLYGVTELRWSHFFDTKGPRPKLSFWSAPRLKT